MAFYRHVWCCSISGASLVRQGQPGNYVICVKAEDRVTHVRIRQVKRIRIHRIHMILGLMDPDPYIIKQK
jgi:hypothetical protein